MPYTMVSVSYTHLLPVAEFGGVGFQMGAGKAQLAQYGEKLRHVRAALPGQRAQIAAQEGGVLGDKDVYKRQP